MGCILILRNLLEQKAAQPCVHWTLGILPLFQTFSSLRVFPAPKPSPRSARQQVTQAVSLFAQKKIIVESS